MKWPAGIADSKEKASKSHPRNIPGSEYAQKHPNRTRNAQKAGYRTAKFRHGRALGSKIMALLLPCTDASLSLETAAEGNVLMLVVKIVIREVHAEMSKGNTNHRKNRGPPAEAINVQTETNSQDARQKALRKGNRPCVIFPELEFVHHSV
jgi:hypothetical protein